MDVQFCIEVLDQALDRGGPAIFNTDQGAQFTSQVFTAWLQKGGCGRVLDNVHVEWLWRSIKCEEVSQRVFKKLAIAKYGGLPVAAWHPENRTRPTCLTRNGR